MPSGRHANAFPQPACDCNGCRCLDPWCNSGVDRELWPSVGTWRRALVHSEIQCALLHRHEGFQGSSSNVPGDRPDTWPNASWCAATPRVPIPGWRCRPEWSSSGTASLPGRSRGHEDRGRRFRCPMRRSVGGVTTPIPSHAGYKLSRRFSWCSRHLQHRKRVFSLLNAAFNHEQEGALQDYVECAVMLQHNSRKKWTSFPLYDLWRFSLSAISVAASFLFAPTLNTVQTLLGRHGVSPLLCSIRPSWSNIERQPPHLAVSLSWTLLLFLF